ncbi:MAG: hypothetical protein LH702_00355, partial [Phormidesmis sp. CAN_BIN44]|nr:hypothetical protein [Phormidesmis sp. CAN_BIN44]
MTDLKAATKTKPDLPQSRPPKKQIALATFAVIGKATFDSTIIVDSQEKKPPLYSTTLSDRPLEKLSNRSTQPVGSFRNIVSPVTPYYRLATQTCRSFD